MKIFCERRKNARKNVSDKYIIIIQFIWYKFFYPNSFIMCLHYEKYDLFITTVI